MVRPLRVVVLGYVVRGPLGGMSWHHLQYVLALRQLGHDALFLEDSDDYASCYDPERFVTTEDPGAGLAYARYVFDRVGLGDRWAYWDAHRQGWHGPRGADAAAFARAADVLLDVSGVNPLREWTAAIPARALIDTDPVFTQLRHLDDPAAMARARGHTRFFTFGENCGDPGCAIPADGLPWLPTRQPIALDHWPATPAPPLARPRFTTVMQWDAYPPREHRGRSFGMKSRSFEPYLDLPRRTAVTLEIALGSPGAPRDRLRSLGWRLVEPEVPTRDPFAYAEYIRGSAGEFTVAKHGYVATRSGWFSERSACYLASGRPVVTEDTGLGGLFPVGEGLLAFRSPEEALDALARVERDWAAASRGARRVAEACFDGREVLRRLIERL